MAETEIMILGPGASVWLLEHYAECQKSKNLFAISDDILENVILSMRVDGLKVDEDFLVVR